MSSIVVSGDTSGSVTLSAPAIANTTVLTLPSVSGSVLTDQSSLNYTGFKNRIINGAMGIWQRGTSFSVTGTQYMADRWFPNGQTYTGSQSTDVPSTSGTKYSLLVNSAIGSYGTLCQRIESTNSLDLVGNQVTLSFWLKIAVGSSSTLSLILGYPTAVDNFTTVTTIQTLTIAPTSSWVKYTATFNALPSQVANGLQLIMYTDAVSACQTYYTGVQLEKGSTATSFDYRPYGTELALCQRYYEIIAAAITGSASTGNSNSFWFYKVTKRATPSVTLVGSTGATGTNTLDFTSLFITNSTANIGSGTYSSIEL